MSDLFSYFLDEKKEVSFFQKKWRPEKSLTSRRGDEVVSIHSDKNEDEPQAGPSGLGSAHLEQRTDTCVADPSPAGESAFICTLFILAGSMNALRHTV